MQFKGVIGKISDFTYQGKVLYSIQLNGDRNYYRCGDKRPNVETGQYVVFDANEGSKVGAWNVVKGSIQVKAVEQEATGIAVSGAAPNRAAGSKDEYWTNREARDQETQKRIEKQSCRNSALEFVKILGSQEAIIYPPKAKTPKDKLEILEGLVQHYTEYFIAGNSEDQSEIKETVVEASTDKADNY